MTEAAELPQAAGSYLEQLRLESGVLPEASRVQLLGQIREHLTEAVDDGSEIGAVLERLGSPRELVVAAGDEEFVQAAPTWRPSALLWIAVAGLAAGVLLLLLGGAGLLLTTRWRSALIAIPGIALAVAGGVLLLRELRASRADPAASLAKRRVVRWLAAAGIGVGVLTLLLAGAAFMLSMRWRITLIAIPGIVLALVGVVTLLRGASLSRRTGVPSR